MIPEPCKHCKYCGNCELAGLVNRLAIESWLVDKPFECADHQADNYHGIEGVYA